jgi:transposase InsO family protein
MPWRERSIVDQREEFVQLALSPGANKRELCRRFGVSRSKGYKWLARYASQGRVGLSDRSRRPHHSPTRTCEAAEAAVLRIRADSNNAWGGRKIAHVLKREGAVAVPAPSTITQILRRHGQLEQRTTEHPGPYQRFEREQANELWQMDFKGHFATGRGRCHPLTIIDDHSRYALGVEACATEQDGPTRERLTMVFRRYGLPDAMLMDNGSPWGDSGGGWFTAFGVWLLRLGIRVAHGRSYHPQTQGKDERFNRTLGAEVLANRHFRDLTECQRAFDAWRHKYNHVRPHQALDLATPSERYRPSRRSFPEVLPPIEYGPDDLVRKADQNGDIGFKGRRIRLGKPFRGMPIALRPSSEDGSFSVHFCTHEIAVLDRHGQLWPVDVWTSQRAMPTSPQAQQQQHQD